jgi:aspartate racemase
MIGIIGGLGVGATTHYYRALVDAHKRRDLVPQLLIAHANVDHVLADIRDGKLTELAVYLAGFADRLAAGGASLGVIVAVAPHICFDELARRTRLPLVSMIAETAQAITARNVRRVALFGTRFVIESDMYGQLPEVEIVRPQPAEIDTIHNAYVDVVARGQGTAEHRATFTQVAHTLMARDRVDAIVLAGTDLATVFDQDNTGFPAIDCAAAHIEGIMRRLPANQN